MNDQETRETTQTAVPVQTDHRAVSAPYRAADYQGRPLVVAFDPYFVSPSRRDFDEIMWEHAA